MSAKKKSKRKSTIRTLETVCPNCETDVMHWVHFAEAGEIPTFPPSFEAPTYDRKINNRIFVHDSSILDIDADVIVVSANKSLKAGGMKLIYQMAGPELEPAVTKHAPKQLGDVVEVPGFELPAEHVFFTVVPGSFESGESHDKLRLCYQNCFNLMIAKGYRSIALPCLGTGGNMINKDSAGKIALETTRKFLEEHYDKVDVVIFCRISEEDKTIYDKYLHFYFPTVPTD